MMSTTDKSHAIKDIKEYINQEDLLKKIKSTTY